MPQPCKFSFLDSGQKGFLRAHEAADLAPRPVTGHFAQSLVINLFQAGDANKLSQALDLKKKKSLDLCLRVSEQNPCLAAVEEDGDDARLVQLELACKADGVASQGLV